MAFNPNQTADCPVEVYGGWVSETDALSLPLGVSPDCPGCAFVPGSVFTRPAFQRVFSPPLAAGTRITYGKSYVAPNGTIYNLYLSSNGTLYLENITTSPGAATALFQTFSGLFARSVTAFGREYIAISDGFHGADVPLQYDGRNLDRVTQDGPPQPPTVTNIAIPPSDIAEFKVTNGQAGVTTSTAHGLQVGYQALIVGTTPWLIAITSIVLSNTQNPGIAVATTPVPHGLVPGNNITIEGVTPAAIGTISSAVRQGQLVTIAITGSTANIIPGTVVTIAGVTDATFDGTFSVAYTPQPGQFSYLQDDVDSTSSGGTANIPWPIPSDTPTPTYFEVIAAPSPTTFQIQVTAPDASWGAASAYFSLDGTFYVKTVLNTTQFLYNFQGPNTSITTAGTVTPFGQIAPGPHLCRMSYLTRQGFLTKPSPWVQFLAPGGQYIQVSNLLIGPPNVVARVFEFTGALGSLFYYIPVPAQVNGQIVSTATQVNDNFTTQITLDFSDNSLFAGLGTSIPGNNTPAQIWLDGALGFSNSVGSYLATWGQRNKVNALLNMGFDGGTNPFVNTTVPGFTGTLGFGNEIINSPRGSGLGQALKCTSATTISQNAYEDQNGDPILTGNTFYAFRMYMQGAGSVRVTLSGTGFSTALTLTSTSGGGFQQASFPTATSINIPSNAVLTISATPTGTLILDEMSLLFRDTPFTDQILNVSYADNPEAFDGITGETGPADDTHAVTDVLSIADIPYILTRDPGGRLHEISNTGTTLPAGWAVNERAANCGALSAFGQTRSQADTNSASGGEEWFAWASESGARIFGGNQPWKISQEIQPNWNAGFQTVSSVEINRPFAYTIWAMNDPVARVMYFGVPTGAGVSPTAIYTMNYRELDSAEQIAFSPPYHIGPYGRIAATDNTRKWSPWYLISSGAARMYRSPGNLVPCFLSISGVGAFSGNVYIQNPNQFSDDDLGQIQSYYTTASVPSKDQATGLQLTGWRKILATMNAFISGVGNVTVQVTPESLNNPPWPLTGVRTLSQNPVINLEWGGGNCEAYRMFFRVIPTAIAPSTDQAFNLSNFCASFRTSRIKARGSAQ